MTFFGIAAPEWVVAASDANSESKVHVAFSASGKFEVLISAYVQASACI
jgi:hypothetical protein